MNAAFVQLSGLCGWDGLLQVKAAFDRSVTFSLSIKNMGGGFFHPMGGGWVSSIDISSSPRPYKVKTNPGLSASVHCSV